MFKDEVTDRLARAIRALTDRAGMCHRNMRAFERQDRQHDRAVSEARHRIYHTASMALDRYRTVWLGWDDVECTEDLYETVVERGGDKARMTVQGMWRACDLPLGVPLDVDPHIVKAHREASPLRDASSSKEMALEVIRYHLSKRMPVRVFVSGIEIDLEVTMETTFQEVVEKAIQEAAKPAHEGSAPFLDEIEVRLIRGFALRGEAGLIEDWSRPMGRAGQPTDRRRYDWNVERGLPYGNGLYLAERWKQPPPWTPSAQPQK